MNKKNKRAPNCTISILAIPPPQERLNASHSREHNAKAYCVRLEGKIETLKAERDGLRQERRALRCAVATCFKESTDRADRERSAVAVYNAATQVRFVLLRDAYHSII